MTTTTMKVKRIVVGALLMVASSTIAPGASAQAPDTLRATAAGRGFFQVGYQRLGARGLNRELRSAGLPAMDRHYLTLGGAGFATRGRFLIGGEGHALLGASESDAGGAHQLSTGGAYGLFRVGFLALSQESVDVYPLLGIGGGAINLKVIERSAPTFDEVLNDPERSSSLDSSMFLMDVGVGANYRIEMGRRDEGIGGVLLGVSLGYTFAPGASKWTLDGINSVAGGPTFQIEGPYVRLSIGGWGIEREGDER